MKSSKKRKGQHPSNLNLQKPNAYNSNREQPNMTIETTKTPLIGEQADFSLDKTP